jgi:hypothetical protein
MTERCWVTKENRLIPHLDPRGEVRDVGSLAHVRPARERGADAVNPYRDSSIDRDDYTVGSYHIPGVTYAPPA